MSDFNDVIFVIDLAKILRRKTRKIACDGRRGEERVEEKSCRIGEEACEIGID